MKDDHWKKNFHVLRSQQIDDRTRHGLYLPAPSSIFMNSLFHHQKIVTDIYIIPPEAMIPLWSQMASNMNLDSKFKYNEVRR